MFKILLVACFLAGVSVKADTPANCMYEDVRGKWIFYIGEGGHDNTIDCNEPVDVKDTTKLELKYPNVVVDEFGNEGFWTMIYNQGFEVAIHGRKFFAFSKFIKHNDQQVTSICNETLVGWSHDVFGRDWACYFGVKDTTVHKRLHFTSNGVSEPWIRTNDLPVANDDDNALYKHDEALIKKINRDTNILWYAKKYQKFEKMTVGEMKRLSGSGMKMRYPAPAKTTDEIKKLASELPDEFDWRNHQGRDFVTPVRSQAHCGSCYAFASAAMNEVRLKIATNNSINVVLSPQDVVDCSQYSQGCDGGFPYLIGGKFSEDFGMIEESCNPYTGEGKQCNLEARQKCTKHYFTKYEYIGGFYGGCNEEKMKLALVHNGPIAVGFQVYNDFSTYGGGVYHHIESGVNFNPFVETNHAVAIVGYGVEKPTGTKYWIVKNSWDKTWGEKGYFRIRRGTNECGIESIAVQSFPIF